VTDSSRVEQDCIEQIKILRLNEDILHHPLPAMIAHGIPTAISNDDPAILGHILLNYLTD
jgi:adenosine deaminase CECR1